MFQFRYPHPPVFHVMPTTAVKEAKIDDGLNRGGSRKFRKGGGGGGGGLSTRAQLRKMVSTPLLLLLNNKMITGCFVN